MRVQFYLGIDNTLHAQNLIVQRDLLLTRVLHFPQVCVNFRVERGTSRIKFDAESIMRNNRTSLRERVREIYFNRGPHFPLGKLFVLLRIFANNLFCQEKRFASYINLISSNPTIFKKIYYSARLNLNICV